MKSLSNKSDRRNLIFFTMLFQFSLAFSSYMNIYLQDLGLNAAQIGAVNAFGRVAAFFVLLLSGIVSDKFQSLKRVIAIVTVLSAALYSGTLLFSADMKHLVLMITVYVAITIGIDDTLYNLTDNILVRCSAERGYNFGAIRAGGSLAFTIASAVCSLIVPFLGVKSTYWLYSGTLIFILAFLINIKEPAYVSSSRHEKLNFKPLLSNKAYWVFALFTLAFSLSLKPYGSMLTIYVKESGISTDLYGIIIAVRTTLEVPILVLMVQFRKKVPLPALVILSVLLTASSAFYMGTGITKLGFLILAQCIYGIANGLQIGSATNYINEIAPGELKATASSVMMMISSSAGFIGNLLGGLLTERLGSRRFYTILGIALTASVVIYITLTRVMGIKFKRSV